MSIATCRVPAPSASQASYLVMQHGKQVTYEEQQIHPAKSPSMGNPPECRGMANTNKKKNPINPPSENTGRGHTKLFYACCQSALLDGSLVGDTEATDFAT